MKKRVIIFMLGVIAISILIATIVNMVKSEDRDSQKTNISAITSEEANKIKFDAIKRKKIIDVTYSVYFYDIEDVEFEYKGNIFDLKVALMNKQLLIDKVIEQAEDDAKSGKNKKEIYMDGGSIKYKYDKFSIIKYNSLDGNRDIYVGKPNMDINVLDQGY